ncbi:MAG: hypothetical protein GY731_11610, partial [Gammaproteobacteria bacterium]|nr:hypothetical protein [Gammaproteobacteria bacterium]
MKGSNRKLYFGEYLIEQGLLAEANVLKALEAQRKETPNFERMALKLSLLSVKEVFQLLTRQADSDLSIAELALRDGYLDAEQVMDVLNEVDRVRPSFGDVLVSLGMLTSAAMETELNRHL